jgi:uncharacterized protein (TIGR02271 family)
VAATSADAASQQRERAGQQALTRSEEELAVDKRVVPKERVQIGKEVVRDHKQVSEPVRKEQVEVDQPDGER